MHLRESQKQEWNPSWVWKRTLCPFTKEKKNIEKFPRTPARWQSSICKMPFSAPSASILKPLCSLWCGFRWKWYRVRKTRYIKQDVANKTEQSGFALISNVAEKFCAAHPYAWSYFKRQAEKKPAIETVTFIQRHFQARDIKPYWSKAQHSKVAHSSTACRGPALGRTVWEIHGAHLGNM